MLNFLRKKVIFTVIAKDNETNAIRTFKFDAIAYNNWMMANDIYQEYEVLEVLK